jgi:hypothetical protein
VARSVPCYPGFVLEDSVRGTLDARRGLPTRRTATEGLGGARGPAIEV